ncbi:MULTISPECIES: J domain-containing protein [Stappiaceae]|uniref:DnaJ-like protein DjlA n=1 Tax=Roseibium aggregatum TaxID=187304 RepID=A0A0M6Y124_9HYPH|nr:MULTISPECIES: DnaJ family molecular chaperone [Stappiaceae]MBO9459809.1 DnaJ family molecular chaperone [Labrenzia sp. R5_0]MCR9284484.1 DnaJ family molecular chaperone [Paracoccaceae bacterium]MEC9419317.1 DnaJ family molecular chaperone [Pseudomonadota bacterium]NKI57246.1 DnaJ family molecular chaperone [Labrenzia sp. PO1]AMN52571.1 dimethylmenaquinone methyltransferase [Labrenzia sp. CP4]
MSVWSSLGAIVSSIGTGGAQIVDRLVQLVLARPEGTNSVGFTVAMIALSAKMAKADGVVTTDEIIAFRELFDVPPNEERNVARLFNLAQEDIAGFEVYAKKLADLFPYDRKTLLDILDGLFHIAKADGVVHESEIGYLSRVAEVFGIDDREFSRILARHVRNDGNPYEVLGLGPEASDGELKSHYRREVQETHPDRLIARGVPEEFVRIANDRLAALNEAWAKICAERGI